MSLGDKPLMVLTAGSVQTEGTGLSPEQADQLDRLHSESQAALTRRSENARQVITEDSGHYIQVEQPAVVVDAVRHVVDAARDGSRLRNTPKVRFSATLDEEPVGRGGARLAISRLCPARRTAQARLVSR